MKYCVIKNTTKVIDGSENSEEVMLQNASSCGFVANGVEIITEEEYQSRIDALPVLTSEPTLEEKNRADIDYILLMQGL